jgi:phosphoserine aminotransferase
VPLVCDASSNIASKPIDVAVWLIYAGAEESGAVGVVLVIIRDDLWQVRLNCRRCSTTKPGRAIPCTIRRPALLIYIVGLVLKWLKRRRVEGMARRNEESGADLPGPSTGAAVSIRATRSRNRSRMNVTFRLPSEELEKKFVKQPKRSA